MDLGTPSLVEGIPEPEGSGPLDARPAAAVGPAEAVDRQGLPHLLLAGRLHLPNSLSHCSSPGLTAPLLHRQQLLSSCALKPAHCCKPFCSTFFTCSSSPEVKPCGGMPPVRAALLMLASATIGRKPYCCLSICIGACRQLRGGTASPSTACPLSTV